MKNFIVFLIGALIGAAIVYFICCQPSKLDLVEGNAPKGIITPSEAKNLDRAFNSRHQLISDSIVKRPDNRSSWYALKDMRDYLNYAESQAKGLGYEMDGIRVYLGAHADAGANVGYTTMFFVPTGSKMMKNAEGSMIYLARAGSGDIPGGDGLNAGSDGMPPSANYPQ